MDFTRPVTEVIRARSSWRAYTSQPLSEEAETQLRGAMADLRPLFGARLRFEISDARGLDPESWRRFSTYGVIRNPQAFLLGAIERGPQDLEAFGHAFEMLVLKATDLGLGTCWLGGTFSRSAFADKLRLASNELMPAVSPVGTPSERRALRDRAMRFVAGSKARKPWESLFFQTAPGQVLTRVDAGRYADVLEMVRLAPSARNKQPWRIVRAPSEKRFDVFIERGASVNSLVLKLAEIDFPRVDAGIALCHFEVTAQALGLAGHWSAEPPVASFEGLQFIASWIED